MSEILLKPTYLTTIPQLSPWMVQHWYIFDSLCQNMFKIAMIQFLAQFRLQAF